MINLFPQAEAAVDSAKFGAALTPILVNVVQPAIALLFAVALVVFVWSIAQMIIKGGQAEDRQKFRWAVLGGVIGMVIMISAWGIVNLIANSVAEFGQ